MASHEALRAELSRQIETLSRRADNIEADLRKPGDRDWVERANEIQNDEVLDTLDEVTLAEVAALRHAVERIDNGTYGRCQHCGEEISAARLEALPAAATCVRCASAA